MINYESRWEIVENVFHRLRVPGTAEQLAGMAFQVRLLGQLLAAGGEVALFLVWLVAIYFSV